MRCLQTFSVFQSFQRINCSVDSQFVNVFKNGRRMTLTKVTVVDVQWCATSSLQWSPFTFTIRDWLKLSWWCLHASH